MHFVHVLYDARTVWDLTVVFLDIKQSRRKSRSNLSSGERIITLPFTTLLHQNPTLYQEKRHHMDYPPILPLNRVNLRHHSSDQPQ
jgi:hypothetical protein